MGLLLLRLLLLHLLPPVIAHLRPNAVQLQALRAAPVGAALRELPRTTPAFALRNSPLIIPPPILLSLEEVNHERKCSG